MLSDAVLSGAPSSRPILSIVCTAVLEGFSVL